MACYCLFNEWAVHPQYFNHTTTQEYMNTWLMNSTRYRANTDFAFLSYSQCRLQRQSTGI